MLFSILEGELEARDLVIDALKVLKFSSITLTFVPLRLAVGLSQVCHLTETVFRQKTALRHQIELQNFKLDLSAALEPFATALHASFFSLHESPQDWSLLTGAAILVAHNKNG